MTAATTKPMPMPKDPQEVMKAVWFGLHEIRELIRGYHEEQKEIKQYVYGGKGRKSLAGELNSLWTAHDESRADLQKDIAETRTQSVRGDWKVLTTIGMLAAAIGGVVGGIAGALL